MKYSNGDVYIGEWANDQRSGYGELIQADGDVYIG